MSERGSLGAAGERADSEAGRRKPDKKKRRTMLELQLTEAKGMLEKATKEWTWEGQWQSKLGESQLTRLVGRLGAHGRKVSAQKDCVEAVDAAQQLFDLEDTLGARHALMDQLRLDFAKLASEKLSSPAQAFLERRRPAP